MDRLEKSKFFWVLLGILLLFFLLRLPSIIEPNWYGDEGIYQVLGMSVNDGRILYKEIWDNKPPLLYLTYALFQGDHFSVRFFSLIIGIITAGVFFTFSQMIFKKLKASIAGTLLFVLLFATPIIEGNIANAENFMLLPIILAAIIIYKTINHENHKLALRPLFFAGLLLGIAFLFKIVAVFDFAAFLLFLIIINLPEKLSFASLKKLLHHDSSSLVRKPYFFILGFLLPLVITALYFIIVQAFPDFIRATFSGMFGYVNYGNKLIIPQGFLLLKTLILASIVGLLILKRNVLPKPMLLIFLWVAFSLYNAFFSQRPYIHYMLVLVPSICLLFGLIFNTKTRKQQILMLALFLLVIATVFTTFKTYSLKKTFLYYQNSVLFITGQKNVTAYQAFFDGKTPRDYQLASYLKMHTNPGDHLFIWGNSAQIYALSHTLPTTKYTVAYHMQQSKEGIKEIESALNTKRPKYVILLAESPNFPFHLYGYVNRFTLEKTVIYERDL